MTTPAVVERQLIDIDLSSGMSESDSWESMDWTKYLRSAKNVDSRYRGKLSVRPGWVSAAGMEKSNTYIWDKSAVCGAISPIGRLMSTDSGVVAASIGDTSISANYKSGRLYQLDESGATSDGAWSSKGRIAEFSVTPTVIAGLHPANTSSVIQIGGVCSTNNYNVVLVQYGTTSPMCARLIVLDKESGNTVAALNITDTSSSPPVMCAEPDSDKVYVFYKNASTQVLYYNLASQSTIPSTYTSAPSTTLTGTPIACVPDAESGGAVVLTDLGDMARFESGSETLRVALGATTGHGTFTDLGVTHDGSGKFLVAGFDGSGDPMVASVTSSFVFSASRTFATVSGALGVAVGGYSQDAFHVVVSYQYTSGGAGAQKLPVQKLMKWNGSEYQIVSLAGVGIASSPFYSEETFDTYCAFVDLPQAGAGAGHTESQAQGACVVCNVSSFEVWEQRTPQGLGVAAVLDRHLDIHNVDPLTGVCANGVYQKAWDTGGGRGFLLAAVEITGTGSYDVELRELKLGDYSSTGISGNLISGGRTCLYDGFSAHETGFFHTPAIIVNDSGSGTGVGIGSYNYLAIFESVDAYGRKHLSKCANPASVTLAAARDVDWEITFPVMTNHQSYRGGLTNANNYHVRYHVYRTANGGTQYYRVASGTLGEVTSASQVVIAGTDSTPDATLITKPLLHRQPGTQGTALDRHHSTSSSCVRRHKDRYFYARGSNVYYSSFDVFGEAPWFNPALSFEVPEGFGPVTGLGSIDGVLVIFKAGSIFVVDGDGPPESGGSGTEFSPPRRLLCETGCIDQRSILHTNDGIMFRSGRGIEILRRNLSVEFIGQAVADTTDSYPYTGGAAFDNKTGRAAWAIGTAEGTYGGQLSGSGVVVVYDCNQKSWFLYEKSGTLIQDIVCADVSSNLGPIAGGFKFVLADSTRAYIESGFLDSVAGTDSFIPVTLTTGWIRTNSKQDRIRLSDLIIGGKYQSPFTMAVQYATDYNDSFTTVKTWTRYGDLIASQNVPQFEVQPPKEAVQSMAFKISTSSPSPSSLGTGKQMDIFALTVKAGQRGGGAKLASTMKG